MFLILALLTLTTPGVRSVTQLQAAEGTIINFHWDSPVKVKPSTLMLRCSRSTPPVGIMLEVTEGEQNKIPGLLGEQFSGRVWLDREALGLGQVRIVLTRISAQDQGEYWCDKYANYQDGHWVHKSHKNFMLTVTKDKENSENKPREDERRISRVRRVRAEPDSESPSVSHVWFHDDYDDHDDHSHMDRTASNQRKRSPAPSVKKNGVEL